MEYITLKCSHCEKKLLTYNPTSRKYKSPLRKCKKCGTEYLDPRCHEIAAEGIPADTFSIPSYLVLIAVGGLIIWRGLYLFSRCYLNTSDSLPWLMPTVFTIMGSVFALGGILEIISIATGRKAERFERLRQESEERLLDNSYARTLLNLGYCIPEKYI